MRTSGFRIAELMGFLTLLFLTRFVARSYLIPQTDQECHIGAIAAEVLANGVRFPLLVYAPNEYDNGSFFSGLLAAVSFTIFGRSVLALKLVTHFISAVGAVATLSLLRTCLGELGLTNCRDRWPAIAVLVITLGMAPRVVTIFSMYAVGNHAEGTAIDMVLLALFASRIHVSSLRRTAAFWVLVGFALYLNKGTFLVIPVLAALELFNPRLQGRFVAAASGFLIGLLPEIWIITQRKGMGWLTIAFKAEHNSQSFPTALFDTLATLAENRSELLLVWAITVAAGVRLLVTLWRAHRIRPETTSHAQPVAVAIVVGITWFHLAALSIMAKNGFDGYVIYGYPTLIVQFSLLVAWIVSSVRIRWGEKSSAWVSVAGVAATLVLYRPDAVTGETSRIASAWRNHAGAACSWRFAEGFVREHRYGLAPPARTPEQHAIARCRSLSEPAQVLDCIGGISRELHWRRQGSVEADPPAELTGQERRAYAYYYGTHRKGRAQPCLDFADGNLAAMCAAAVRLECLVFADIYTRFARAEGLCRPNCVLTEPPMPGFWAEMRIDLLNRTSGTTPDLSRAWGDDGLASCKPVFDECYGRPEPVRFSVTAQPE